MKRREALPSARWSRVDGRVVLELAGDWSRDGPPAHTSGTPPDVPPQCYVTDQLGDYDSTLPAFLFAHIKSRTSENSADAPPLAGLPPGLAGLMKLSLAVPEEIQTDIQQAKHPEILKLGEISIHLWQSFHRLTEFFGQAVVSTGRLFRGKARFRPRDLWIITQDCGANALPIVSLISFLIGLIFAFVGNVELANFGAGIYVADLVAIAMFREMGVVMTSIIMSGRTGAAFASHLGSMKTNQEIDALRTFGFDPFDFLVLPRVIALVIMMPLLTIYANLMGILGGMLVGSAVGIPPVLYWNETLSAIDLTTVSLGVFKSVFFGAAIALCGCMQGMYCGNSSAAVGQAATRAVVMSITSVIVLDSGFAAIFTILDI